MQTDAGGDFSDVLFKSQFAEQIEAVRRRSCQCQAATIAFVSQFLISNAM